MKNIQIDKKRWAEGIESLKGAYHVFGPVRDREYHSFKPLAEGEKPDFDFQNTRLSPKSLVHPQSEKMFEYSLDESREDHHRLHETKKDGSPRAMIGIRPCDADAFLLVKRNFDSPEYKDPYWVKAYEATTFVGLACSDPCRSCFCTTAGSGPFSEKGLDVLLVDTGDAFLARVLTEKGESLARAAGWTAEAPADSQGRIDGAKKQAEEKIVSLVHTENLRGLSPVALFEAPFWEDVAFSCINCGTCTFVCPTCWCFDIQDETSGSSGIRMRNWDSCMFPLFTLHGSGHNPRSKKTQRVRQRFMHKLKYYVDKYDNGIQCVGCGRCVRMCPVNIDIRKVCETMNSQASAEAACQVS